MKCDILIAGVGGQGILTIATILGRAALDSGFHIKQSEVHGMAQRGGSVSSHLRVSSKTIHADVIRQGRADMLVAMEPMEGLRYLPWLAPRGWLVVNAMPAINIPDYPPADQIEEEIRKVKNTILFDASKLAADNGSARAVNVALLGAAAPFTGFDPAALERAMGAQFAAKGEAVVAANLAVFRAARAMAEERAGR